VPRPVSTVLLLGARSEIGGLTAERLVRDGARTVLLAARGEGGLEEQVARLTSLGATTVVPLPFDADDLPASRTSLAQVEEQYGPLDVVLLCFGVLGDQGRAERDAAHAVQVVHTDYVAQVSALTVLASRMRDRGQGALVVFSSVAGVRVRKANYVYGSAKAGLDGFASGLGDSLAGSGARVLLVRPGFVIGRMTEGMSPAPFASTPQQVADAVVRGLHSGAGVVWVPGRLRWLFAGLRLLPQPVWRRLPR
jgi:NAD(P)-dependent dehydrogenase (short-subunit alcohol dehydrogenase family)